MPKQRHLLTLALIACALLLRAIVPVGWMPAAHGGPFSVEPCPSADSAPMMHMVGASDHHHRDGKTSTDCFASMLAGAGLPDARPAVEAPAAISLDVTSLDQDGSIELRSAAPPPPSTGPPISA